MSLNNLEEEILSPRCLDEPESARKRKRLDSSNRKSWSLTEKQTDQEVLLEMGVSILDPEEIDSSDLTSPTMIKTGSKRKRDIENVNPNVNSALVKPNPKRSPKKFSPVPGPSVLGSPSNLDCSAKSDNFELQPFHLDEETPEVQFCAIDYRRRSVLSPKSYTPKSSAPSTPYSKEDTLMRKRSKFIPEGPDTFSTLSDEVLLSILKWLPKRTLAHCMMVCKRWHRVASDETFWQRLELGNKVIASGALGRIIARKPVVVRLAGSEIGPWQPTTSMDISKIQYLDLSMCTIDKQTLSSLLSVCRLIKLSLEAVPIDDRICEVIGTNSKLETLNLTMCTGITSDGLKSLLKGCTELQSLNISWCGLCVKSLELLGKMLPQKLQRLNLAGARIMTDDNAISICDRCPRLLELDLSDCSRINDAILTGLTSLSRLEHLAVSRCYLLPPRALTKLNSMPALQYLEVWGMLQDASLNALKAALPAIQINQFIHSAIARPTVGTRRTSIWGLRTRD